MQNEIKENLKELEEIDDKLKSIVDLTHSDKEMDDIAKQAMSSFEDLMSLGMNIDARAAAPIFEAASKLMGHAITAKTNKIDKKLRLMDLELKRRRLEHQIAQNAEKDEETDVEGIGRVIDRNELLKIIKGN